MKRWLRRIALSLAALVALVVLVATTVRLLPVSGERAAALRLLEVPMPAVAGRDGTDALWLVEYDVPHAERAAVARAFRELVNEPATPPAAIDSLHRADRDPRARFPKHPEPEEGTPGLCALNDNDCLATVAANADASAAVLASHPGLLAAARDLTSYDGFRVAAEVPFAWSVAPTYKAGRALAYTALAERFVRGQRTEAIADTCREIAAWRRLGANDNSLVGSMIGSAYARQDAQLLAAMLAQAPELAALPAECELALAPARAEELDLCPAMRSEFLFIRSGIGHAVQDGYSNAGPVALLFQASFDPDHVAAVIAPGFARYCGAEVRAAAAADASVGTVPQPRIHCGRLEWLGFPVECTFAGIGGPDFDKYADRRTDFVASIALVRTLAWLRATSPDPATWPALLRNRPANLGLRREPTLDLATGMLSIPLIVPNRGSRFELIARPTLVPGSPADMAPK